ncbi:gastrokine-1-like [Heteronotia binoei]|uniref:gastrokine-1-like n=1 Tax=Heteronotia binoei TaxID=13085 RepID=UPI002931D2EB|nr:gastrokine-1-like [Heteronotia binoei]
MKFLKALAAFFGVILSWSLASEVINASNQRNVDSNTHQAVNVNQQAQIVNIHNYHGWNGWDAIWDYRKGLFATRLFRKRACVVATMDLKTFPRLETLSSFRGHKTGKNIPLSHDSRFSIGKTHVKNLAQFGLAIEQLCRGIPTYYAHPEQGTNLPALSPGCANVGILNLFGISLCGNIPNC